MAKLEKTKPNFFKRMFMDDNDINEKSIVYGNGPNSRLGSISPT